MFAHIWKGFEVSKMEKTVQFHWQRFEIKCLNICKLLQLVKSSLKHISFRFPRTVGWYSLTPTISFKRYIVTSPDLGLVKIRISFIKIL